MQFMTGEASAPGMLDGSSEESPLLERLPGASLEQRHHMGTAVASLGDVEVGG